MICLEMPSTTFGLEVTGYQRKTKPSVVAAASGEVHRFFFLLGILYNGLTRLFSNSC